MNIGRLDTYCRVEFPVETQEGEYGTPVVAWTPLSMSWLNLQDVLPSHSESVQNGLNLSKIQTRVRGRYRTDMNAAMRIVTQTTPPRIYNLITEPAVIGNKDGIEFMVERMSS